MPKSKRQKQEEALLRLLKVRHSRDNRNNYAFWSEVAMLKSKLNLSTKLTNDEILHDLIEEYGDKF